MGHECRNSQRNLEARLLSTAGTAGTEVASFARCQAKGRESSNPRLPLSIVSLSTVSPLSIVSRSTRMAGCGFLPVQVLACFSDRKFLRGRDVVAIQRVICSNDFFISRTLGVHHCQSLLSPFALQVPTGSRSLDPCNLKLPDLVGFVVPCSLGLPQQAQSTRIARAPYFPQPISSHCCSNMHDS